MQLKPVRVPATQANGVASFSGSQGDKRLFILLRYVLIIGAAYLFYRNYITWHIPLSYVATVALTSWVFNGKGNLFTGDALFFVLSGGLMLGAFFMATDYITSPLSSNGKIIFGIGCGILTFVIRKFAGYPEGVSYSILMMNAAAPIIDRYTFPKWFGWRKK